MHSCMMYETHKTNCKTFWFFFSSNRKRLHGWLDWISTVWRVFKTQKFCYFSLTNKTLFDNITSCMSIFQKDQRKLYVKIHLEKTSLSGCQLDFSIITLTVRCLNCIVAADDTSLAAWPTPWINSPGVGGANSVLPYFKKVAKRGLA